MFGILWPARTFMASLSYADGFIRCRDTLGSVVPLSLLAAPSPALHELLFGAERRLCYPGSLSRRVEQADQGPFSLSTSWATPQGQLTSQGLTFLIGNI